MALLEIPRRILCNMQNLTVLTRTDTRMSGLLRVWDIISLLHLFLSVRM